MEASSEADERLELLRARRAAAAERPESASRDAILRALDDMIVELETADWPDYPPEGETAGE
jgi:hypothetical protein